MSLPKTIAITLLIGIVLGFVGEYYLVKSNKTQETQTSDSETTKSDHKETTTVTEKSPDGTEKTTTTIVEDKDKTSSKTKTDITVANNKLYNISVMGGYDLGNKDYRQIWGVSASKEFLGHISVGAWGMTNGTAGLSLGVDF